MAFAPIGHIAGDELERRLLRHMLQSGMKDPLLSGTEDLEQWFSSVELACAQCAVPHSQYTDAAIILINDTSPLLRAMQEHRRAYLDRSYETFWPWHSSKIVIEAEVRRLNESRIFSRFKRTSADRVQLVDLTFKELVLSTTVLGGLLGLFIGGTAASCIASAVFLLGLIGKGMQALNLPATAPRGIHRVALPAQAVQVDADEAPQDGN